MFVVFGVGVTLVTFEKNLENGVDGVKFLCLRLGGKVTYHLDSHSELGSPQGLAISVRCLVPLSVRSIPNKPTDNRGTSQWLGVIPSASLHNIRSTVYAELPSKQISL